MQQMFILIRLFSKLFDFKQSILSEQMKQFQTEEPREPSIRKIY